MMSVRVCLLVFVSALAMAPASSAASPSGLNFAPAVAHGPGGFSSISVAVADVNGDGKPDLLVANLCSDSSCVNGSVSVLLGKGDGSFQTAVAYASGGYEAVSVAVADVNGDGKPDLLVATECSSQGSCDADGTVGVLLGNGDGTFQTAVTYSSGAQSAHSVAVADVNGDGKPDLVLANCGSSSASCANGDGSVGVLLGNGDGTFQTAVTYGSGGYYAQSVAVADLNGDGKPDLVVVNESACGETCVDSSVGVLLGNGDGTFQTVVTYGSGGNGTQEVTVADVNGDGKPDLLVATNCASSSNCTTGVAGVLLGNGDGTFQTVVTYGSGGYGTQAVAVADVNGDGKPDLLVANACGNSNCNNNVQGTLGVLLGNGDGTFRTAVTYGSGSYKAESLAAADVNGDGKPDLLVVNVGSGFIGSGDVGVLVNTSIGSTATALTSSQTTSKFGQAVTFTATVTASPKFFEFHPTGTVSFYSGATNIGNSNLNGSGVATLTISSLLAGTHSVTATYKGDTNFAPSTSPVLSQTVQGAVAELSACMVTFGNETVGMASAAKSLTLTNRGNIDLTIASLAIAGTDGADFTASKCPASLAPNGTCTISVTFKPMATGARTAELSITDSAPSRVQKAWLTGVGVLPAITLSPTSLTFPAQVVYTTSAPKVVTLKNTGAGDATIKIAVTGPFSQTHSCGTNVNPGSSCTISVTFEPKTMGALTGSLTVTDNASNSPQKVALEGTGTYIKLAPTSINFGNQPEGSKSLAKQITLTNEGAAAVTITSIATTGTDSGDFAQTHTCGASVASGASCFINVTFTPSATGARSAQVSVSDNGGGSPQKVSLTGTGTP
jgi:Bacterial Ig-like domain (group 3)/FG-GAP-like repeat/Abnormal spindle-like microcephaly-assoc'd, ASPM-SPD-2-Hydin